MPMKATAMEAMEEAAVEVRAAAGALIRLHPPTATNPASHQELETHPDGILHREKCKSGWHEQGLSRQDCSAHTPPDSANQGEDTP